MLMFRSRSSHSLPGSGRAVSTERVVVVESVFRRALKAASETNMPLLMTYLVIFLVGRPSFHSFTRCLTLYKSDARMRKKDKNV